MAQSLLEANGGADSDNKDLKGSSDNKELKCSPDSKKDKDPSKDKLKVKKEKKVAAGSAVRVTTDRKIATHQEAEVASLIVFYFFYHSTNYLTLNKG